MIKPIIVKNTVDEVKYITDLSNQYIEALGTFELSDYHSVIEINHSQSLKDYISDGTFIINDGTKDLSIAEALTHTKDVTNYEVPKKLVDLPEVPPIEANKVLAGVDDDTVEWIDMPSGGGFGNSGGNYISFSYSHGTKSADGLKIKTKTWAVVASFIYDGSDLAGLPEKLKILGHSKDGSTSYVRIYDYTNDIVIAELTIDNDARQIWIGNTVENLPTGRAIFELQGKVQDSKKYLYIQAMAMGV